MPPVLPSLFRKQRQTIKSPVNSLRKGWLEALSSFKETLRVRRVGLKNVEELEVADERVAELFCVL